MNYFIFQSTTARYDLRKKFVEEESAIWFATRYRSVMSPGDVVFFWLAGPDNIKGIYGWGELESVPFDKPEWNAYGVKVRYKQLLSKYISVKPLVIQPYIDTRSNH